MQTISKTIPPVMKKLLYLLLFIVSVPTIADAQILVNNQNINEKTDINYIELIVDQRLFMQGEVFAVIDYGQTIRTGTLRQHRIRTEQGKDRLFGSEMDIFNFLFKNGWIHETTYAVGKEGYVYHIFRRRGYAPVSRD
jgi:hypothetical protein